MKRGFLNSPRHKRTVAADTNARLSTPSKHTRGSGAGEGLAAIRDQDATDADVAAAPIIRDAYSKEKGKEKATDPANDAKEKDKQKAMLEDTCNNVKSSESLCAFVTRVPPRRRGWGRDPEEDVLHTVPPTHGGPGRKRCVFREWPRALDGMPICQTDRPKGKVSPDGYPWGATLYDLFCVNRLPPFDLVKSYMTSSALLGEMKAMGELDAAAPEIEWAESEGEPRDEGVADTEELVICKENQIRLIAGLGLSAIRVSGPDEGGKHAKDKGYGQETVDAGSVHPPPEIPVTSPFHRSHYPEPWPFVPFENDEISILLQDRIPYYLLPRTLYVHDPFELLTARKTKFRDTQWSSRPDVVHTYNLSLSKSAREESKKARKKAEEMEEFKARTLIVLRYKRTEEQIKHYEPVIEVPLPPYPRRLTGIEEAHLYVSPVANVGEGHHSVVYKGEWELPRDLFVRPTICPQCFKESADKEVQRLKDAGRWEKLLRAASWGPKGYTGRKPTRAELAAASDVANLERDGETIEREIICVVPANCPPPQVLGLLEDKQIWNVFMESRTKNTAILDFASVLGEDAPTDDSAVACIRIDPPFSYESQKNCTHNPRAGPVPRTTKFTVITKLSFKNDPHLAREARNYQEFPDRFFRHYSGYTIITQLHAVVPVHAIVPQFYGYYEPCGTIKEDEKGDNKPYLSPILLLEHCGHPIDPDTLSAEDQEECASMLLRFQLGGWLHESVYPRNFLVQKGRPTEFPLYRQVRPELSFRMIDFGRSRKWTVMEEKRKEEVEVLSMFKKLIYTMGVTLG